jgi:hypothetical protein
MSEKTAKEWIADLEAAVLDEAVHEAFSVDASNVNNAGKQAQLETLRTHGYSEEDVAVSTGWVKPAEPVEKPAPKKELCRACVEKDIYLACTCGR